MEIHAMYDVCCLSIGINKEICFDRIGTKMLLYTFSSYVNYVSMYSFFVLMQFNAAVISTTTLHRGTDSVCQSLVKWLIYSSEGRLFMQAVGEVCKQKLRKSCKSFPSFLFPPSQGIHMQCSVGQLPFPSFLLD